MLSTALVVHPTHRRYRCLVSSLNRPEHYHRILLEGIREGLSQVKTCHSTLAPGYRYREYIGRVVDAQLVDGGLYVEAILPVEVHPHTTLEPEVGLIYGGREQLVCFWLNAYGYNAYQVYPI